MAAAVKLKRRPVQQPVKKRASTSEEPSESNPPKLKKARKVPVEPTRRSTRLVETASKEEHTSLPDDFSDSEVNSSRRAAKRASNIRQLPVPEIPEADSEVTYDPDYRAPLPTRDPGNSGYGKLHFEDTPYFTPNLTPSEIMRLGSFGGTYWRPFYSRVCRQDQDADFTEFPKDWCTS